MNRLILTLLLSAVFAASAFAETFTFTYGGQTLNYESIDDITCKVLPSSVEGDLELPLWVMSNHIYAVTTISENAFNGCSKLTSVTIPSTVSSIGNDAFLGCTGLTKAEFESVESLCDIRFDGWSSNPLIYAKHLWIDGSEVTDLVIPSSVTSIYDYAFYGCSGLTSVTISNSVMDIGNYAFRGCSGLTSVTIPNSVTSIGAQAFYGCSGLTSIAIPNSVTSIGSSAFAGRSGLTKAEFASIESLCSIKFNEAQSNPLYYAKHLYIDGEEITSLVIPETVTTIGDYAFCGGRYLTSVTIPNSVTSIGSSAFSACSGLTSVTIPNFVTSIGSSAFSGCSGLTSVTISNSVISIGGGAFYGCSGLTSVIIGNSVKTIGDYAFYECRGLPSVIILNSVISIGERAFFGCNGLTSVIIGSSVKTIGDYAFYGCDGLKKSAFPNTISGPFDYGLRVAYNPEGSIIEDGWIYGPGKSEIRFAPYTLEGDFVVPEYVQAIGLGAFAGCSGLTSVTIPSSVKIIGQHAFEGCSGLTSVTIPNSVTLIGSSAFYGCSGLNSVIIGNSVTSIDSSTFEGCSGLKKNAYPNTVSNPFKNGESIAYNPEGAIIEDGCVYGSEKKELSFVPLTVKGDFVIPEYVQAIGNSAFSGCYGLTSVTIPNSVKTIGESAFSGCRGLTSVIIGNSVTSIGNNAFYRCSSLKKSVYPNTVSNPFNNGISVAYNPEGSIIVDGWIYGPGKSEIRFAPYTLEGDFVVPEYVQAIGLGAFAGCSGLTSVTIPSSVKIIGQHAFEGCSGLTSMIIPNSVTSIGEQAFYACNSLTWVVIGNSVETIGNYAFYGCDGLKKSAYPNTISNPFKGNYNHVYGTCLAYNPEGSIIEDGLVYGPEKSEIRFAPYTLEGDFVIPDYVQAIGSNAFEGCSGLKTVTIPNSVNSIGNEAFYGCSGLSQVVSLCIVPPGMSIDSFSNYDAILTIPQSAASDYLTTSWALFKNIHLLDSDSEIVTFSDGVLNYRLIPAANSEERNTAVIVPGNYNGSIAVPERFSYTDDQGNVSRYYVKGVGFRAFYGSGITEISFNSRIDLETIGESAFEGCSGLSSFSIPNTVTSIGASTFKGCSKISSIVLPPAVKSLGDSAFYDCTRLQTINLTEDLETIGGAAFSLSETSASTTTSLTIPASLKHIGKDAFCNRYFEKVVIKDLRKWIEIDFETHDSNPAGWSKNGLWLNEEEIVDLVIPDGVEEIKPYTFVVAPARKYYGIISSDGISNIDYIGRLKSVTIPCTVKSIGAEAFWGNGFQEINIPASVEFIGSSALSCGTFEIDNIYNTKVSTTNKKMNFEDGVTPIVVASDVYWFHDDVPWSAPIPAHSVSLLYAPDILYLGRQLSSLPDGFSNKLRILELSGTLTEFPKFGFSGCSNLGNVIVGNSITEIPDGSFSNLSSLGSLTLGSSLTSIGENAFSGCTALKEVVVPPSVETIGASAFAGNTALKSIIMGHSVKTIGEKAFDGCPAQTVSITAQTPPTAPNNTFSNYSGKLWLQDPGDNSVVDAYYDAYTCWDRFNGYAMVVAKEMKYDGAARIEGKAGDTFQLTATLMPENVTLPQVFWRSTNPEIATVDANGVVTLHKDMSDIMTMAEGDGDDAATNTCKIIAESLYADGPVLEVTVRSTGFSGVDDIIVDNDGNDGGDNPAADIDYNEAYEVYNLSGMLMGNSTDNLRPGIYIVRQGSTVKKVALR